MTFFRNIMIVCQNRRILAVYRIMRLLHGAALQGEHIDYQECRDALNLGQNIKYSLINMIF